jgi:hypothetical protein
MRRSSSPRVLSVTKTDQVTGIDGAGCFRAAGELRRPVASECYTTATLSHSVRHRRMVVRSHVATILP